MFCWSCGKSISEGQSFCGQCGLQNSKQKPEEKKPLSFNDFVKERSSSRSATTFPKKSKIDKREVKETTIYASVGEIDDVGNIKQIKGSRLPVKVEVDWGSYQLKNAVFDKLERYNNLVKGKRKSSYRLAYRNGETVKYLPGTEIEFTVKKYKEDLGVGYSSILVYLIEYEYLSNSSEDEELPTIR